MRIAALFICFGVFPIPVFADTLDEELEQGRMDAVDLSSRTALMLAMQ
ncbi:MAG: hypothetical protein Q9M23_02740 [Mariprofundaceae bacterium]|nr:hypothetical protein [Mariprofundaceae bacterium]